MTSYYNKAIDSLDSLSVGTDKTHVLKEFAVKLMNREN